MKNFLKLLIILLILSLLVVGCSKNKKDLPSKLSLEDSIREILLSKDENHDFLNDDVYINHMDKLVEQLINDLDSKININYTLGNLTENNIPELVIFKEKDPSNIEDQGTLEVYNFDGMKYKLLDSISMSFDASNHEMKIGKLSPDQRGLLLNNNIGSHSRLTYGYILEEGKLKSILNDKKISLISVYAENQIIDINDDGILEFSIITVDPETEDADIKNSDKMVLWYKWDGEDSGDLIHVERENYSKKPSNKKAFNQAKYLITNDFENSLDFILKNKNKLSKYDNTILVKSYLNKLNEIGLERGIQINNLFFKYGKEQEINLVSGNRSANVENLNTLEYLNREKVLKDNKKLKKHLIDNINLGFKLNMKENVYLYLVNYDEFIKSFEGDILNEYIDYLKILKLHKNDSLIDNENISKDRLIEKILFAESFKMIYPYSEFLPEIKELYINYINLYFFGEKDNPNYHPDTKIMKKEILEEFEETAKTYEFTNFSYIINDFLNWVKGNNSVVDDELRQKLYNRLN